MSLLLGLLLGGAFGAVLQLAGASSHTLITNALRLKDLTIIKLILVAIGVGLIGVQTLDAAGLAHLKIKNLYVVGLVVAGIIFGIGFAVSGYCPGTALAAAGEGKPDAFVTVLGGLTGAVVFAFLFPYLEGTLLSTAAFGKVTVPDVLGIRGMWVGLPLGILLIWASVKLPKQR